MGVLKIDALCEWRHGEMGTLIHCWKGCKLACPFYTAIYILHVLIL